MASPSPEKTPKSLRRWIALVLALVAVVVAIGIFVAVRHGREFAHDLIETQLHALDLTPARFRVEALGWRGIEVADFELGDPPVLTFPRLFLQFSPLSLLSGRASRLEIEGLVLQATLGPDGISLGALDPLFHAKPTAAPAESSSTDLLSRLPVEAVEVNEAHLALATADGPVSGEVWLRLDDSRHLAFRFESGQTQGLEQALGFTIAPFSINAQATLDPQRRSFDLEPTSMTLAGKGNGNALRVETVLPAIALSQEGGFDAPLHVTGDGGHMHLSHPDVAIQDLKFDVVFDPQQRTTSGHMEIGEIREKGPEALTAPLQFTAAFVPTPNKIVADFDLATAGRQLLVRGQIDQDLEAATGRARFEMKPLQFIPETQPIGALFPLLKRQHVVAAGTAGFHARAGWGGERFQASLDLELENLSLAFPTAGAACLNGVVRLTGPPFSTPQTQEVSMTLLDIGFVLGKGLTRFRLQRQDKLTIERAEWKFLGGHIVTAGSYDLNAPRQEFLLAAEDISLQALFELLAFDGLTGEGVLGGHLPIAIHNDRVEIQNGVLASGHTGGWIRYRPPEGTTGKLSGFGISELIDFEAALQNFQFERIVLQINGDARGALTVQASLEGANPDYRGGQPYKLNLSVEGPLYPLYKSEQTAFFTLPKRIEELFVSNVGDAVPDAVSLPPCNESAAQTPIDTAEPSR